MQENLKDNNGCSSVNIYERSCVWSWFELISLWLIFMRMAFTWSFNCVWLDDCVVLWVPIIIPDDSCWLFHCTQSSWVRQNLWRGSGCDTRSINCLCTKKLKKYPSLCNQKTSYIGVEYMRLFLWVRYNRDVVCYVGLTLAETWSNYTISQDKAKNTLVNSG